MCGKHFRLTAILLVLGLFRVFGTAQSDPVSLGDYGRAAKKSVPAPAAIRVYDNDNTSSISTENTGESIESAASRPIKPCDEVVSDQASHSSGRVNDEQREMEEIKIGQSPDQRNKAYEAWQERINKKKKEIDTLTREVDDLRTNAPQGVALFHIWPDDVKYNMMLRDKQKGLERATEELGNLQEEARRAGVPSHFRD